MTLNQLSLSQSQPRSGGTRILSETCSTTQTWLRALEATSELGEHSLETLPTIIEAQAEILADAPALISRRTCLSYRQLAALSNRYSRWALKEGLPVGGVVGIILPNRPEYLAIWLGLTRVGVVAALLNPSLSGSALATCIDQIKPDHLIIDGAPTDSFRTAEEHLKCAPRVWALASSATPFESIDSVIETLSDGRLLATERKKITLSHRALQIFTSDGTDRPRAANVSHYRIMMWSRWFAGMMNVQASDRMYDCLPFYQSLGGVVALGSLLVRGGSVIVGEQPSAPELWHEVVQTECTLFQYNESLAHLLLRAPTCITERAHKLRMCCGKGLTKANWSVFKERFQVPHILEFYASTEANVSLFNVEGEPGASGRVPPFTRQSPVALIKVDATSREPLRDDGGRCQKALCGETGEALGEIGSDAVGLFGRFEGFASGDDTDRSILRDVFVQGDTWVRTGDLMRIDQRGFYHFVARVDEAELRAQ